MITRYIILFFFLSVSWPGKTGLSLSGNKLYQAGEYEKAKVQYLDDLKKKPQDVKVLHNLGLVYYKLKDFNKAVFYLNESLKAAKNTRDISQINYNLGVVQAKNARFFDASEAFKKSLLLNSENQNCRENLQLVLNRMRKQNPEKAESKNSKKQESEYVNNKPDNLNGSASLNREKIFHEIQNEDRQKRIELHNTKHGKSGLKLSEW